MSWRSRIPKQFQEPVDNALAWAKGLLESGNTVPARFFVGNSDTGELFEVTIDTVDPDGRARAVHQARLLAAMHHADFVVSVIEAWALPAKDMPRHSDILEQYGSLAAYPGRQDVLAVQLETHEGIFSLQAPIRPKPPSKKKRVLAEVVLLQADAAVGQLANVLPAPPESLH
ncbi:hypothetical protein [Ramlibacter alkalitolerans]|uniref:Uncharacterized protein n=1 Tax=Ramlibacter alkalitolerans TaxID=2039631 RepID=A0ABS1JTY0_9BURK|nr:hypothetical protein [Ramlibacter alkalitolerans]MBL0427677.1 hypothetical protein [Ramlibacter alkalitolerans]